MLLNLLTGVFDILAGTVGRATTHRSGDKRDCGNQQQNYSFGHNRWFYFSNFRFSGSPEPIWN